MRYSCKICMEPVPVASNPYPWRVRVRVQAQGPTGIPMSSTKPNLRGPAVPGHSAFPLAKPCRLYMKNVHSCNGVSQCYVSSGNQCVGQAWSTCLMQTLCVAPFSAPLHCSAHAKRRVDDNLTCTGESFHNRNPSGKNQHKHCHESVMFMEHLQS